MERSINISQHTHDLLEQTRDVTGLDMSVDYWNGQAHILIGGRHLYAGTEREIQSFLYGATRITEILAKGR